MVFIQQTKYTMKKRLFLDYIHLLMHSNTIFDLLMFNRYGYWAHFDMGVNYNAHPSSLGR